MSKKPFYKQISIIFLSAVFLASVAQSVFAQTSPPSGIIGWWPGDGDARDISGNGFNGTFAGELYKVGKVGQSFEFINQNVRVPDDAALRPAQFTVEAWIKIEDAFEYNTVIAKGYSNSEHDSFALVTLTTVPRFFTVHGGVDFFVEAPPLNNPLLWHHLAASYDGLTSRIYVDGALAASLFIGTPIQYDPNPVPLTIGADWAFGIPQSEFGGQIDEPALYNRALSGQEIQAIFNAGVGGKTKRSTTAAGANSQTTIGDATTVFQNVATAGITTDYSIDPAVAGPLPAGYTQTGLAYDLSTTAIYSGPIGACFHIPAISDPTAFSKLKILHLEGGTLVDKTTSANFLARRVCGSVSSLSPFVIANGLVPSAAKVSVGGRVVASTGRGINNVSVRLTDAGGRTTTAKTSSFGFYRFDDVAAGETYILSASTKSYSFQPLIVTVSEELTGLDLTAEP